MFCEEIRIKIRPFLYIILSLKGSLQQQLHFNGNIFGNIPENVFPDHVFLMKPNEKPPQKYFSQIISKLIEVSDKKILKTFSFSSHGMRVLHVFQIFEDLSVSNTQGTFL